MLRIAVCDDDKIQLTLLKKYLKQYSAQRPTLSLDVAFFRNRSRLLDAIRKQGNFSLYLLNMMLPPLSGIEIGGHIRAVDQTAPIIYLTGSADFAPDAFRVRASGYLLKPVEWQDMCRELDIALSAHIQQAETHFVMKTRHGILRIPMHDIAYGEWRDHILRLCLKDGRTEESVNQRSAMDIILTPLARQTFFCKCHKSYIVNLTCVQSIQTTSFLLHDGTQIPIAQRVFTKVKKEYLDFCENRELRAAIV